MKSAPKVKKGFDVDRFIGGAATVQADVPKVEEGSTPEPKKPAPRSGPKRGAAPKRAEKAPAPKQKAPRKEPRKAEPTPPDPLIRTSFDLPESLQKRLKVGAVIKGTTMRDLVEKALEDYLNREGLPEAPGT